MARTIQELKALGVGALASEVARLERALRAKTIEFDDSEEKAVRLEKQVDATQSCLDKTMDNMKVEVKRKVDIEVAYALKMSVSSAAPTDMRN